MPVRNPEGGINPPESDPLGDDCRLRGVSLRRSGGDWDAASLLFVLPGEPLRNGESKTGGYLANCWITTALPVSAACGVGGLNGDSIFCYVFVLYAF
jgi:hypothetical protein